MIAIAETIAVPCPPKRLWDVVSNPADVVSCIGGAELGAAHEDGSFDGALVVRFGGVRVKFTARITLELEPAELTGRLSARGKDGQAATRFAAEATFRVAEGAGPEASQVAMDGEIRLSGKLASLIESGAGIVVSRMTKEFTENLVALCAPAVEAPVTDVPDGAVVVPTPAVPHPGFWSRIRTWWSRLRAGREEGARS